MVTTLGSARDAQIIDGLEGGSKDHFYFTTTSPYSVGEAGRVGPVGREIGHGRLAYGVLAMMPDPEEFLIRFV